eukprot:jgi/Botrbrau1/5433/Bobra.182_1s0035.1
MNSTPGCTAILLVSFPLGFPTNAPAVASSPSVQLYRTLYFSSQALKLDSHWREAIEICVHNGQACFWVCLDTKLGRLLFIDVESGSETEGGWVFTSLEAAQGALGFRHWDLRLGNVMEHSRGPGQDTPAAKQTRKALGLPDLAPLQPGPAPGRRPSPAPTGPVPRSEAQTGPAPPKLPSLPSAPLVAPSCPLPPLAHEHSQAVPSNHAIELPVLAPESSARGDGQCVPPGWRTPQGAPESPALATFPEVPACNRASAGSVFKPESPAPRMVHDLPVLPCRSPTAPGRSPRHLEGLWAAQRGRPPDFESRKATVQEEAFVTGRRTEGDTQPLALAPSPSACQDSSHNPVLLPDAGALSTRQYTSHIAEHLPHASTPSTWQYSSHMPAHLPHASTPTACQYSCASPAAPVAVRAEGRLGCATCVRYREGEGAAAQPTLYKIIDLGHAHVTHVKDPMTAAKVPLCTCLAQGPMRMPSPGWGDKAYRMFWCGKGDVYRLLLSCSTG